MQPLPDSFIAPKCEQAIEILYQDEAILLINKPSGLLSLSGKNPANLDSVHYRLCQDFPAATLLHRLDFGTSGIMLVALNKTINAVLMSQFQQRTIKKSYTAILAGQLTPLNGSINLPIAKAEFPRHAVCLQRGKHAQSDYQVHTYCKSTDSTKVTYLPVTGRTHQLRIHSQAIGHPILGCDLYGTVHSLSQAPRLMLHATSLTFTHPITLQRFEGVCPSPF